MPEGAEPRLEAIRPPSEGRLSRRGFLQGSALSIVGLPTLAAVLAACSKNASTHAAVNPSAALKLAAPDNPITWPIATDNPAIKDSMTPEHGATLQLYNYADYIDPGAIKSFEKKFAKYNVKVAVSTFNDADEALTKIRAGKVPYDIYFPSYDQISKLVSAKLVRPLNHSYIKGIANVWPTFSNPWYDGQWRYTVPYTVYTTGIGYRADRITEDVSKRANPYDVLWDPKYQGKTAIIDDFHTAMGMVLLRNKMTNLNTDSADALKLIGDQLAQLSKATAPKVTITMYNDLPTGKFDVCQMWSGDAVQAVSYLPKGTSPEVLRYWFPPDGKGEVDNDLMTVLSGGKNPVLAHLFIDHMLSPDIALGNFSYIGYQPPQRTLDIASVVKDQYVPAHLAQAVVKEEYFTSGYRLLELSPANDAAWHQVWQTFKAGA